MKQHLRFVYGILSVLIFELVTCPAMGQGLIKRDITPEDYKLWSKLYSDKISDDGNWISYELRYESHHDTLFIKNTITNKAFDFPKCSKSKFGAEKVFGCMDSNKNLKVLDLVKGNLFLIPDVVSYEFSNDGQFIISLEKNSKKESNLSIRNIDGKLVRSIENVTEYEINKLGSKVIYTSSNGQRSNIGEINFSNKIHFTTLLTNLPKQIQNITCSNDETCIAFYGKDDIWQLYFYKLTTKNLSTIKKLPESQFAMQGIAPDNVFRLNIADDNSTVFFSYKSSEKVEKEKSPVEIWNAADKFLFLQKELAESVIHPYLAIWYPQTQIALPLSNQKYSWVALTGDQKFAILADPLRYEPQHKYFAEVDYYLMNLKTAEKELVIQKVSSHPAFIGTSPNGRFINYYKNNSWWIYDVHLRSHTNITEGLPTEFDNRKIDPDPELYGCKGWTADNKKLLIYDRFDLWLISIDGKKRSRLTNGKEKKIRFRLVDENKEVKLNYSGNSTNIFNPNKKNVLSAESHLNADTGYFIMGKKSLKTLDFSKGKISSILKAKKKEAYVFTHQSFSNSPSLFFKPNLKSPSKNILKTNMHQNHFYWGSTEMIHYTNSNNISLNGALFYPANYKASIKYPMIVYIYSKPSFKINEYVNPTDHNNFGFNISTSTANGYFVLLADIAYEKGNPGISAVDCVTNAVNNVLGRDLIDVNRIGLLGHSFGGYETNFILTQTNLFAAAVSGAGVSDIIRTYFSISDENQKPELWRYENQQFRMVYSFYEDKDAYLSNCPILNADKINTPLLTWAGKDDVNVKPEQSMALYLALRRLNKTHIMLQYPKQRHILSEPLAQEDLSKKTMEWFDYYLKNKSPASWIVKQN